MLARRGLLKFLGSAPLTLPGAQSVLMETLSTPAMAIAAAATATLGPPSATLQYNNNLGALLSKELSLAISQAEDEHGARWHMTQGHFDPDIACLKSVSNGYKARKQFERQLDGLAVLNTARRLLYGN